MTQSLHRICWLAGNAHPQHVDGGAEILDLETGLFANDGATAVRADDKFRAHFEGTELSFCAHSGDAVAIENQAGDFGLHA